MLLDVWRQACEQPIGLVIRTNDQVRARARLYAVRRGAGRGVLPEGVEGLELRLGSDPGELLLVRVTRPATGTGLTMLDIDDGP